MSSPVTANPEEIVIEEARFSLIWNRTFTDPPFGESAGHFTSREAFSSLFQKVRDGKPPVGCEVFAFPWRPKEKNTFWQYYIDAGRDGLTELDGGTAWDKHVPMREKVYTIEPIDQTLLAGDVGGFCEVFHYPHGRSFVLTIIVRGTWLPRTMIEDLNLLRHRQCLRPRGQNELLSAEDLAEGAFARPTPGGAKGAGSIRTVIDAPVSVFTAIHATNADVEDTTPILPLLGYATTWQKSGRLPSKKDFIKGDHADDLLTFGRKRGIALWHRKQLHKDPRARTLNCLHRNQTMLALQVESLANFLRQTSDIHKASRNLDLVHESSARQAIRMLDAIGKRDRTTYKGRSAEHQILEKPELASVIEDLREILFM